MKKRINKPMRAAGALLVATMLTTCMTAGTFAKYVTNDSATDSARVAKFGVTVNANGTLFGTAYDGTTHEPIAFSSSDVTSSAGTVRANSTSKDNVVAPGTKNATGIGLSVEGIPEVDVDVALNITKAKNIRLNQGRYGVMVKVATVNAVNYPSLNDGNLYYSTDAQTFTKCTTSTDYATASASSASFYVLHDYVNLTSNYFPVVYKLTGDTNYTTDTYTTDSLAAVINTYASQISATTFANATVSVNKTVKANNDLAGTALNLDGNTLTWEWKFYRDAMYDGADTILGDLMAAAAGTGVINTDDVIVTSSNTDTEITTAATAASFTYLCQTNNGVDAAASFDDTSKTFNLYTELDMSISVTQVD